MTPFSNTAEPEPSGFGSALFPQHIEYLVARGVGPEVARERGYRSANAAAQLQRLGFSAAQAATLLVCNRELREWSRLDPPSSTGAVATRATPRHGPV